VGRKREGTVASRSAVIEPLDDERIRNILDNPKSEPYIDRDLSMKREDILFERLERIKKKKSEIR